MCESDRHPKCQPPEIPKSHYFDYNPVLRFEAWLDTDIGNEIVSIDTEVDGVVRAKQIARVHLDIMVTTVFLSLFWLFGYGGSVFLPFRDVTKGRKTNRSVSSRVAIVAGYAL